MVLQGWGALQENGGDCMGVGGGVERGWCPALGPSEVTSSRASSLAQKLTRGGLLCWPRTTQRAGLCSDRMTDGEHGMRRSPQDQRGGVKDMN